MWAFDIQNNIKAVLYNVEMNANYVEYIPTYKNSKKQNNIHKIIQEHARLSDQYFSRVANKIRTLAILLADPGLVQLIRSQLEWAP